MAILQTNAAFTQQLRQYGGGIRGFFSWWRRALAAWLPMRVRSWLGVAEERLLLAYDNDQITVSHLTLEGATRIAQLPWPIGSNDLDAVLNGRLAALPRWWLLASGDALQRRIVLPGAATDRLRDVVGFEIDRLTPFQLSDVFFDAQIVDVRADGQIEAEMVVIPRHRLQTLLNRLGGLASQLVGVDVAAASGQTLHVNLLPVELRYKRTDPSRLWTGLLGVVALVAVLSSAASILSNRQRAAEAFEAQVNQEMRGASAVAAQRQQLLDTVSGNAFLARARSERPPIIEILDELTHRLPDSTYLESISIEGGRLQISGQSIEASSLVAKLEGARIWRSPALSGALQPDARTRRDRFNLSAELVGSSTASSNASGPGEGR